MDCQIQFVRSLLEIEKKEPGSISETIGSVDKIGSILDYCMNALEIAVTMKEVMISVVRPF